MVSFRHHLGGLGVELASAGIRARERVTAIVEHSASNITDDARQRISGHPHLPHYPDSITFDVELEAKGARAEIGPDADLPQGALGPILERGTANSPPMEHLHPAVEQELPAFEAAVLEVGARSVFR